MSDTPPVPRPDDAAGAAAPVSPIPAAAPVAAAAVPPTMLRLAGGLIVLAGVFHVVSYFAPLELAILVGILQSLALVGAFVVFLRAGFPHRGTVPRALSIALIVIYAISGLSLLAIASEAFLAISVVLGFLTLGVGIAFGVVTMRTAGIAPQLARLPIALYLALFLLGRAVGLTGEVWLGAAPALAYLVVGTLFIVFADRVPAAPAPVAAPPAPAA